MFLGSEAIPGLLTGFCVLQSPSEGKRGKGELFKKFTYENNPSLPPLTCIRGGGRKEKTPKEGKEMNDFGLFSKDDTDT